MLSEHCFLQCQAISQHICPQWVECAFGQIVNESVRIVLVVLYATLVSYRRINNGDGPPMLANEQIALVRATTASVLLDKSCHNINISLQLERLCCVAECARVTASLQLPFRLTEVPFRYVHYPSVGIDCLGPGPLLHHRVSRIIQM